MRKKAQKTAREDGAEINNQDYLFGCLCHGGYKLYFSLWDQNQTRIKMNNQPPPQSQESSKKECRKSYRAHRFQGHRVALLTWLCIQLCHLSLAPLMWYLRPDRDPETAKLPSTLRLNTTSLSFISSSRIRVFFLHERSAVHDGQEGLTPGSRTPISRPLKPLLRAERSVEAGVKAALTGLKNRRKRENQNKPPQVHLFSNKRRN